MYANQIELTFFILANQEENSGKNIIYQHF